MQACAPSGDRDSLFSQNFGGLCGVATRFANAADGEPPSFADRRTFQLTLELVGNLAPSLGAEEPQRLFLASMLDALRANAESALGSNADSDADAAAPEAKRPRRS